MPQSMRYDELRRLYPNIEQLFAGAAGYTHDARAGPELAAGWAGAWIDHNIAEMHQPAVREKIEKFIAAIKE